MTNRITHEGRSVADDNPFPVRTVTNNKVRWITSNNWSTGEFSGTSVIGSGSSAYVGLSELSDNADNIPYATSTSYTPSDGAKIEVASGKARLKAIGGTSMNWPYTTPANYSYSTSVVEVTGGVAKLLDLSPTDSTFYANYDSDVNGTWGSGDLTGTSSGGASVSGGKLDLKGGTVQYVSYDADLNADSLQTGCIRFTYTPDYSGVPAASQLPILISKASGNLANLIQINHLSSGGGDIRVQFYDTAGSLISQHDLGAYSASSGVPREMELNYNFSGGITQFFLHGTQLGSTITTSFTRGSDIGLMRVGSNVNGTLAADFEIDDLIVFSTVQHTANYTAGASIPQEKYSSSDPKIIPTSSFSFTTNLTSFSQTSTIPTNTSVRHIISHDAGTTFFWYSGGWTVSAETFAEANSASTINTNISAFTNTGIFIYSSFLHSTDGVKTPELNDIQISEPIVLSTDDNLYVDTKDAAQIAPTNIIAWLTSNFISAIQTNTAIGVLLSKDGRVSWDTYSGGWSTTGSPTLRASSISLSDATLNFPTFPLGSGTLDVRVFLKADTITATTPEVSNISVTSDAGFATSGRYRTATYDSTYWDLDWGTFSESSTLPTGTTITFRTKAGNTTEDMDAESFGSALSDGDDAGVIGQGIQFRIDFTGDGNTTGQVSEMTVKFTSPAIVYVAP